MESFNDASDTNRRFSKYVSEDFQMQCTSLKIPDVYQYVSNIQLCMLDADGSRRIIDDIIHQIEYTRKKEGHIVNSTGYPIGSLIFDSRTFAQRNIREWCSNVAKTNDSLYQILNIVLRLGNKPWNRNLTKEVNKQIAKTTHKKLKALCDKFHDEIQIVRDINNFSKHNQNIFGIEKFSPLIREKVEYHLRYRGEEYKVSELITADKEVRVMKCIVDILDYLFDDLKVGNYRERAYVFVDTVELPYYEPIDTVAYTEKPDGLSNCLLSVTQTIKPKYDNTFTVSDVMLDVVGEPFPKLELAECYKSVAPCCDLYGIGIYRCNLITVFRDNKIIGEYRCEDIQDQEEVYFHFKTYIFHAIS